MTRPSKRHDSTAETNEDMMVEPDTMSQDTDRWLEITDVTKSFRGSSMVLNNINLTVNRGEVMFLLGSSGSGKSTLLRIIAGLTEESSGRLLVDGRDLTGVPARKRGVGFVFQNFALFPHLTAKQNIEFALGASGVPKNEWSERIDNVLELGHIQDKSSLYPAQLSGGQQQRLAVARAVASAPKLMLFDEPLSALDAVVRRQIRRELRDLMRALQVTSVFVSHDFMDVLDIGTRVAVLVDGQIEQVGTPQEVYRKPESIAIASLTGRFNEFRGNIVVDDSNRYLNIPGVGEGGYVADSTGGTPGRGGDEACVVVRPEDIKVEPISEGVAHAARSLPGVIIETSGSGGVFECQIQLKDESLVEAKMWAEGAGLSIGTRVNVSWDVDSGTLVRV